MDVTFLAIVFLIFTLPGSIAVVQYVPSPKDFTLSSAAGRNLMDAWEGTLAATAQSLPPLIPVNGSLISTIELTFDIADETDAEDTVGNIITHLQQIYPGHEYSALETSVQITMTGVISNALYEAVNDEFLLYETIKEVKAGTAAEVCAIRNPSSRRRLQLLENEYPFELVCEFDATQFQFIDGIDVEDDPAFVTAVQNALGLEPNDAHTVTAVDNLVIVQSSLKASRNNSQPLGEELIDDITTVHNNLTAFVTEQLQATAKIGDGLRSSDLILCPVDRTCTGQGNDQCDGETGVCECAFFNSNYWWGINCETPCECANDAKCIDGMCHCKYPYWGLRCDKIKEECNICEN